MHPTQLFVYGTLRHDQPEHAKYCRGVAGWAPARLRAQLWTVPAGYRLAVVASAALLLNASADAANDESRRAALTPAAIAAADAALASAGAVWLEGEVLSFRDAAAAWPPLDRWEEFVPGGGGCYMRAVVPVAMGDRATARLVATWAYVALEPPPGSELVTI